jgi:hypothetical protein
MHLASAAGTPQVILFGPTNPFHWRPRKSPAAILFGESPEPLRHFQAREAKRPMKQISTAAVIECYAFDGVGASGVSRMKDKAEKKVPFRETIRVAWKPYKRPLPVTSGPTNGGSSSASLSVSFLARPRVALPLVLQKVTSTVFHGAAPNPGDLAHHPELLNAGGSVKSIVFVCLLIPAVMTVRSLMGYGNAYYMNWVSNRVVTDIRNQLFAEDRGSIDGFL